MGMFDAQELAEAVAIVRRHVPPTPQYAWPQLGAEAGAEVWVKHENHTPTGAFKIRGGLVLARALAARGVDSIVTATRGNHGQSLSLASRLHGIRARIVVPEGNDPDQNAAMTGFGADVVVHGQDFQAALQHAQELAAGGAHLVWPFEKDLVRGVATYAAELFDAAGPLDAVYVPIGMGSGICGLITVRDLLGLRTEIVGVVAEGAPAYALSFAAGHVVTTEHARTFADGAAVRTPDPDALAVILAGAADVIAVGEEQIRDAVRMLYRTTHNVAEGAGALGLAGLLSRAERHRGQRVAVVLSGQNISAPRLAEILA